MENLTVNLIIEAKKSSQYDFNEKYDNIIFKSNTSLTSLITEDKMKLTIYWTEEETYDKCLIQTPKKHELKTTVYPG